MYISNLIVYWYFYNSFKNKDSSLSMIVHWIIHVQIRPKGNNADGILTWAFYNFKKKFPH